MKLLKKALISLIVIVVFLNNPQQTYATEGGIFLFDDFNDGNLDGWNIESGNWSINNGNLYNAVGITNFLSKISIGDKTWSDYRIELDVNNTSGVDEYIAFRYSSGNAYVFNLRHGNNYGAPEIKFFKLINGNYNQISSINIQELLNSTWYHIKIEVIKDNIKLWVKDNLIFNLSDTSFKKGGIGFQSWTGSLGIVQVRFDNVKVTSLAPQPFLDLPWDYSSKGLSFNEAALHINSFFDHQYPLLSRGLYLNEPATASTNIVDFSGHTTTAPYSKHDGYDYGNTAKARINDPMLAAADGWATYHYDKDTIGNAIFIDHGNGYQTRYFHMVDGSTITKDGSSVWVNKGQEIGKIGATGYVVPAGNAGAHIHFMVVNDKDNDGDFNDNIPDGVTDPYGWQSTLPDPWENYSFNYLGQNKTGNSSNYLWINKLADMTSNVSSNGAALNAGNFTATFPQNSTNQNLVVNVKSAPVIQPSDNLRSLGSTLLINATDTLGNTITRIQNPYSIVLDFSSLDLSKLKPDTLSFYSSADGINWIKENTSFLNPTTAQTQIDHMSYFALIGEKRDILAPTTTAELSGTEGQTSWFNSDVQLTLNAEDNEGGLGVEYTLYRINDSETQEYKIPLNFNNEGHYKVEFYSVDNDDNIERLKSIEFDIDKTPPEAKIYFDDTESDLSIIGLDTNQTTVTTQDANKHDKDEDDKEDDKSSKKIYIITDQAGNTLELNFKKFESDRSDKKDKSKEYSLKLDSLKYNDQNTISLPKNQYSIKYETEKKQTKLLQEFTLKDKTKIRIRYNGESNKSEIYTVNDEKEKLKETRNGLIILSLTTKNGNLEYSY